MLGARLKGDQKKVADYLKNKATEEELEKFLVDGLLSCVSIKKVIEIQSRKFDITGKLNVLGFELTSEEVAVSYASKPGAGCEGFESASNATVSDKGKGRELGGGGVTTTFH